MNQNIEIFKNVSQTKMFDEILCSNGNITENSDFQNQQNFGKRFNNAHTQSVLVQIQLL